MKLVICTKFQVNRMNCVESRRGGGQIDIHPPLEVSCNYFFFEASRVKLLSLRKLSKPALPGPGPVFLCFVFLVWRSVGGRGEAKMMKHIGIKLIGLAENHKFINLIERTWGGGGTERDTEGVSH